MTTYREAIRTGISARLLCSVCLLLCLFGLRATGIAQVTSTGQGIINTFAGIQGVSGSSNVNGPATQTNIGSPAAIVTDASGNVYFIDDSTSGVVWVVLASTTAPPLLSNSGITGPYVAGNAYAIVNADLIGCSGTCGDGGPATQAALNAPAGLALDASGNLYIADTGDNAIRKVDATTGTISTIAGDPMHTNFGYSGENVPALGTLLFGPTSVAFDGAGNLYISDAANNIIRKINTSLNISTVAGTVPSGGNPVGCTAAPCGDGGAATSATLDYVYSIFVDTAGDIYAADSSAAAIRRIDAQTGVIQTVAGILSATAPSFPDTCTPAATPPSCGDGGAATSALLSFPTSSYLDAQGNLYIADQGDNGVRVVDTSGIIHTVVGQLSSTGAYAGDGGAANQAMLNQPFAIAFGLHGVLYVTDQSNDLVREVIPPSALTPQTVTFTPPATATYGGSPISLSATSTNTNTGASTGLSATFSVTSGPGTISGSTLTITGAGTIVVKASQSGNTTYGPATPVSASIVVAPATLTVIASPTASLKEGDPIPLTFPYSLAGFVNPDTQQSVVTGAPSLRVKNAAGVVLPPGAIPPTGTYTIVIGQGTLAAGANYQFAFTNGSLLVTAGLTETVSFGAYTPPTVYGGANSTFTFSVTSSAGLPVTVTPTPVTIAKLQQLSTTTWSLTVVGAGQVTLTAVQAGNETYSPQTVAAQFVVSPAVLTIPLNNATSQFGAANPSFSYGTPTGFIGADNSSVLNGGVPAYATPATATSDPGAYPLTATAGTLFAQNYTFQFIPATLTIVPATQQIMNLTAPANVLYQQDYALQAAASSGLPIVYSATGAVQIDSSGVGFQATGVGPATVTATQAGNIDYAPVSATISFSVPPFTEYVTAVPVSAAFGDPIPQLNWCFAIVDPNTGLAACSTNVTVAANLYSGAPALTTTAAAGSPTGSYPITVAAGTLTSSVYSFVFAPGALTITPASTYTLTANPASISLPRGQSRQVTITLTPINNFIGTVTIACSGLPAGVTCTESPSSLTTSVNYQGNANPVSGTLTISAGEVVAQNATGDKGNLLAAGILGPPGMFAGVLIFYRRKQFKRHSIFTGILLLVALAASITCVSACGGGGSHSGGAQPGTTQIMITGTGTASAGAVAQSVGLTVTIE